jgi:predicted esterase
MVWAAVSWAQTPDAPAPNAAALPSGELVSVAARDGITQNLYVETSTATPAWVIVLFAGDNGALHLGANGPTTLRGNFLIRTASYWVQQGDAAVLIDTPSDYPDGVDDTFRLGQDALRDVEAAVAALRQRFPSARIALVGTSRGTVSVGNVVEHHPDLANAFVLTSPVSIARNGNPGLSGLNADGTRSHVLVVSNRNDACPPALFDGAAELAAKNRFDLIAVESTAGGGNRRADCTGRAPHGFYGIEQQVLDDIDRWLAASVADSGLNPAPPNPPTSPRASPAPSHR